MKKLGLLFVSALTAVSALAQENRDPGVQIPSEWSQPFPALQSASPDTARTWWRLFNEPLLSTLVERALKSNPNLKTAIAKVDEARAARGLATSALKPVVTGSGAYTRFRGGMVQDATGNSAGWIAPLDGDLLQSNFDSYWQLDLAGGLKKSVKAADANLRASEEAQNDVRVLLSVEVAKSYLTLRGTQRQLAVVRQNSELQQDAFGLTRARREAGLAPELDVIRAEALFHQTMAEAPLLEAEIERTAHALAIMTGTPPGTLESELLPERPLPSTPESLPATVPAEILLRRPDLRREVAEIEAAASKVGVARSELYPKLALAGLVGPAVSLGSLALGFGNFFSVGPNLRLPSLTPGRTRANIAVAQAQFQQATSRYQTAILNALADVENALSGIHHEKQRANELVAAQAQTQDAVALTVELYSKGLENYLVVLDAERQLLAIEQQLARSRTELLVHLVELYGALGGGW